MRVGSSILSLSATLLVLVGNGMHTSAPGTSANTAKSQITVLYDAFGKDSAMQKDWRYAALVEYGGKRILFDTGNNPDILAQNAKAKGIDLSQLDFVIMSHRHGDHIGGLGYLLKVNPRVTIYAGQNKVARWLVSEGCHRAARLRNQPNCFVGVRAVTAQEPESVLQAVLILPAIFVGNISPLSAHMQREEFGR